MIAIQIVPENEPDNIFCCHVNQLPKQGDYITVETENKTRTEITGKSYLVTKIEHVVGICHAGEYSFVKIYGSPVLISENI